MAEKVRGAHMAKKRGGIDGKDVQSAVCMSSDASRNSCIDYVTDYINNTTKQRELGFRTRTAFPMGKRLIFSEFTNVLFCY